MRWIREMVNTSWDWRSMLLKDFHNLQYHFRVYMNKRESEKEFNTSWDYIKD
jgi:hypothetical protein